MLARSTEPWSLGAALIQLKGREQNKINKNIMENLDFNFVDLPAWKKGNLRYWSSAVYATFFEEK